MKYQLLKKLWISATFIVFLIGIAETYSIINNVKSISNESQIPSSNPNVKPPNVLTQNIKSVSDVTLHASGLHQRLRKRDLNIGQGFRTIGKATAITGWTILYFALAPIKLAINIAVEIVDTAVLLVVVALFGFVVLATVLNYFIFSSSILYQVTERSQIMAALTITALVCTTALSIVLLPVALVSMLLDTLLAINRRYFNRVHILIGNKIRELKDLDPQPIPVVFDWNQILTREQLEENLRLLLNGNINQMNRVDEGILIQRALDHLEALTRQQNHPIIDHIDSVDESTGGYDGWLSRYANRWDTGEAAREHEANLHHVISPGDHHSIAVMTPYIESINIDQ